MELYGRALGRASTSPFAEDKTAADAIEAYRELRIRNFTPRRTSGAGGFSGAALVVFGIT